MYSLKREHCERDWLFFCAEALRLLTDDDDDAVDGACGEATFCMQDRTTRDTIPSLVKPELFCFTELNDS